MPVSSSNATTARAYRSEAGVAGLPSACSGARYPTVPRTVPVRVSEAEPSAVAIPKSATCSVELPSRSRFAGFTAMWPWPPGTPTGSVTYCSLQTMLQYAWPGNVRELDHTLERAVLMCQTGEIQVSDLGLNVQQRQQGQNLEELRHRGS